MNTPFAPDAGNLTTSVFFGLAPLLRMSIAGIDFFALTEEMLSEAERYPDDAQLWMNLSTALLCQKQEQIGLAVQNQALTSQRVFPLRAAQQPAKLRLLMFMTPGNLSANMPLDCLLEDSDIDLIYYYVTPGYPLSWPVPEHDAAIVAISAADETRDLLQQLEPLLQNWPTPVINAPRSVAATERNAASLLLQNAPGLVICPALHISRSVLQHIASGALELRAAVTGEDFPIILRPEGSHGGRGLDKITAAQELDGYLSTQDGNDFFLSRFIDYSDKDGLFRKYRIVLIEGAPYPCHMAISSHWMVHYVNAGMYEDQEKRAQEAAFLANFADFAARHRAALAAIYQRTGLDYIGIDCAQTQDGQLLVFEIATAMVVHAMDEETLFPHKKIHMQKVKNALQNLLLKRVADRSFSQSL